MKIKSLSVFFPAYNEEKNIKSTTEDALKVLKNLKLDKYEVIIVDDGSKDKTGVIADELAKKYKEVRVIHQKNGGYGEALKTGFYNSKYALITTIDSDGQFDFSEVTKLLKKLEELDAGGVVGYRITRKDSFIRKLNGWGWTNLTNLLLGIGVKDVDCSFKLVKKEVIDKIPKLESTRGGMISPELWAKVKRAGYKIGEVPVRHYSRKEGEQTGANYLVILKSFIDLFKLWWKIR